MKKVDTADFIENEHPLLQNLYYSSLLRFPSINSNCFGFSLCQFYSNLSLGLNFFFPKGIAVPKSSLYVVYGEAVQLQICIFSIRKYTFHKRHPLRIQDKLLSRKSQNRSPCSQKKQIVQLYLDEAPSLIMFKCPQYFTTESR